MKNQKGFTAVELVLALVVVFGIVSWVVNIYTLSQCDFEAPYKAEAIHGIGVVTPAFIITAWVDVGK